MGGAGVNAASRLLDLGVPGARFVALDTSAQTLARAPQARQLALTAVTRGLGTGGDPRLGAAAVLAELPAVRAALGSAPAVLVVAGLAGGTGGGAGPEVARQARKLGCFTLGFGIRPFGFEAVGRRAAAGRAEAALRSACDSTVILDNDMALALTGGQVPLDVALRVADDVLRQAVQGLGGLLTGSGWIRVDLAHVEGLLAQAEPCLALGVARGSRPAQAAMAAALASPFTDRAALARATAALVQVTGGPDLSIADTAAAVEWLRQRVPPGCEVVVGAACDPALAGAAQVMLLGAAPVPEVREPIPWPAEAVAVSRLRRQPAPAAVWREVG